MKQTTLLKSSALILLMALCPSVDASKDQCDITRGRSEECSVCLDDKCCGCKLNFVGRDHEVSRNLVVKDSLTVCGDQCISGNLKVRGCITASNIKNECPKCPKCSCCYDDEINFNAQDMHRNFLGKDTNPQWLFMPDAHCTFFPLFNLVPGWNLGFFNPIAMEFEVPKDFCNKRNIEVDLHLFAKTGIIGSDQRKRNTVQLPKQFARLILVGAFAGECEAVRPRICAQKVVEVCPLFDGSNGIPNPEETSELIPLEICRHFKVTFCLDPKRINKCDLGQLMILRVPLRIPGPMNTIAEQEWGEFHGQLILSAVSFRYRKKECKKRECRLSERCDFMKQFPTWPDMNDVVTAEEE